MSPSARLLLPLLLAPVLALARGVSAPEAETAARGWLRRHPEPMRTAAAAIAPGGTVRTLTRADGVSLCHIVPLSDGGWIATSADTALFPIVAFSDAGDAALEPESPLYALLVGDMEAAQRALAEQKAGGLAAAAAGSEAEALWEELLDAGAVRFAAQGVSSVSDVRVAALVKSRWNQGNVGSKPCYNYYTPSNYVCGCVATAMAQIMRYHEFPTAAVTPRTFSCSIGENMTAYSATMFGGTYDWSTMTLSPASNLSDAKRQEIGKICFDAGVSVRMNWTSEGSGSFGCFCYDAFRNVFGYASAQSLLSTTGGTLPSADLQRLICSNCDGGYPTLLGISSTSAGGHAVVADGYGYTGGTLYTHLNMGWSGLSDVWYALPDIATSAGYTFTTVDSIVYNVFPTGTGDLLTGRVTDLAGNALSNVTVTAVYNKTTSGTATTDANGIYALRLTGGRTYTVTATCGVSTASRSVALTASGSPSTSSLGYDTGSFSTYGMKAGNSWGNDFSIEPRFPPDAPTELAASQGTDLAGISLAWDDVDGAVSYAVYRGATAASAVCLASNLVDAAYYDAPVRPGVPCTYWVTASSNNGESELSQVSATGYRCLSTPFGTSITRTAEGVSLTWAPVAGATHYRVLRADVSTGTKTALTDWQATTAYVDATESADATDCYFVEAACDATGARPSAVSSAMRPDQF